jgi:hypothetical protein
MNPRGRHWIAFWLVFFLGVMATVVERQTSAFVANEELSALQEQRRSLESSKNSSLRRIQEARSRLQLTRRARTMDLRPAADSEVVDIRVPGARP